MATKRFKSTTGYPVTTWITDDSGNAHEIRVGADEAFETDDKMVINALSGSPEVQEVKGSSSSSSSDDDDSSSRSASKSGGKP